MLEVSAIITFEYYIYITLVYIIYIRRDKSSISSLRRKTSKEHLYSEKKKKIDSFSHTLKNRIPNRDNLKMFTTLRYKSPHKKISNNITNLNEKTKTGYPWWKSNQNYQVSYINHLITFHYLIQNNRFNQCFLKWNDENEIDEKQKL